MKPLSILIADDHEVVRQGIRALLGARPEWKICGEAAAGREASDKAKKLSPDLVLLDLSMPEMDGLEAIPRILNACPGIKIVVLTMNDSGEVASQVLAAGRQRSGVEIRRRARSGSGRSIGRKSPTVSLPGRHETDHRSFGEDQPGRTLSARYQSTRT